MEPVRVDGVAPVAVFNALWALALVLTWMNRSALEQAGNGWWVPLCFWSLIGGLIGLTYLVWRRARVRRGTATQW